MADEESPDQQEARRKSLKLLFDPQQNSRSPTNTLASMGHPTQMYRTQGCVEHHLQQPQHHHGYQNQHTKTHQQAQHSHEPLAPRPYPRSSTTTNTNASHPITSSVNHRKVMPPPDNLTWGTYGSSHSGVRIGDGGSDGQANRKPPTDLGPTLNPALAGVRSNSLPGHIPTLTYYHHHHHSNTDHHHPSSQNSANHSSVGGGGGGSGSTRPGLGELRGLELGSKHSPPWLEGSTSWHAQRDARIAERRRHRLAAMSPPPGGERYIWGHIGRIRRERLRSQSLESTGKLQISPEMIFDFTADDLTDQGEIGRGAYGTVNKMYHEQSNTVMAVKRIRSTVDEKEQKQLLMDLDVVMRSNDCPYIVQFFGALFKEGDCWICMELMSISLDKFYKYVYGPLQSSIPEDIMGKVTVATLKALSYLKDKLTIIHRDVKPSNILLDTSGNIKLCDFGISGQLVDSIAKTRDAGCRPYMAPERIDPRASSRGYDIRSDVWSLGITLVEVATGKFPYPKWNSVFEQLTQVVQGDPPTLKDNDERFSPDFISFVNTCLIKDQEQRPKYNKLLKHQFIRTYDEREVDVAGYVSQLLAEMPTDHLQLDSQSSS